MNPTHVAMLDVAVDEALVHEDADSLRELSKTATTLVSHGSDNVVIRVVNELSNQHPRISEILRSALAEGAKTEHITWLRSQMPSRLRRPAD